MPMSWSGEKIKSLRKRLGWSSSDLARRLSVDCEEVMAWENNKKKPAAQIDELALLEKQAELNCEVVAGDPLAEMLLEESRSDQCDLSAVKRRFSENN